ncbi:hypothetical protein BaRGS_00004811 [Batillaria attramentaria]|uniref:E3 ubiquitin-protein ligase n=1 Tax=Batillaria attramentaria TaxID=370345 RepID=A0ABD0LWR9_9CAEN
MEAGGNNKDPRKLTGRPSVTYSVTDLSDDKEESSKDASAASPECAVCLQPSLHPVQLPCRHIFCFLCVKGVAIRSRRCALCRQEIPPDFLVRPNLLPHEDLHQTVAFDEGYQWYYEGVNGWWQYDARTSLDLEAHHKKGDRSCELLIAGFVYVIDFENMVQFQQRDRSKKRRIKRDLINIPGKKGVAGLKIGITASSASNTSAEGDRPSADGTEANVATTSTQVPIPISQVDRSGDQSLSPPTPYNTPQTPQTPSESPPAGATTERDLSIHLERLRLSGDRPLSESSGDGSSGDDTEISFSTSDTTQTSSVTREVQAVSSSSSQMQELESAIYDDMDELEDASTDESSEVHV